MSVRLDSIEETTIAPLEPQKGIRLSDVQDISRPTPDEAGKEVVANFDTAAKTGLNLNTIENMAKFKRGSTIEMVEQAGHLAKRFGKQFIHETIPGIVKFLENPTGIGELIGPSEAAKAPYRQRAYEILNASLKDPNSVPGFEKEQMVQPIMTGLYNQAKFSKSGIGKATTVGPPATGGEMGADWLAGITAWATQIGLLKKIAPEVPDKLAWEFINQANNGLPGTGLAMHTVFGGINSLISRFKGVPETPTMPVGAKTIGIGENAAPEPVIAKITQQIEANLVKQKIAYKEKAVAVSRERGSRAEKFTETRDALIAEGRSTADATQEAKKVLAGALTEEGQLPPEFRPQLTDEEWNLIQKAARDKYSGKGEAYTQLNASEAITKIREGKVLTPSELHLMEDTFGTGFAEALEKQVPLSDKWLRKIQEIAGAPRALMSGGDISYTFRQLLPVLFRSPTVWAKTVGRQVATYFNPKKFQGYVEEIKASPYYEEAMEHNLPLAEIGKYAEKGKVEEAYPTQGGWMAEVPLMERGNYAATIAGNYSRMALYEKIRINWDKAGQKVTGERLDELVRFIADLTGRSLLPGEQSGSRIVTRIAGLFNTFLFSPRLAISRVKNVTTAFHSISSDPLIRAEGLKTLVGAVATTTTVAATALAFGYDVTLDPRSADFMKAKKGNTRYDLLGSHGQLIRFMVREAFGQTVTPSGRVEPIDRQEVVKQFAKSKYAPIISLATEVFTGRDFQGQKIEGVEGWSKQALDNVTYLWLQDGIDALKNDSSMQGLFAAAGATTASWAGVGTQIYPETALTTQQLLQDKLSQAEFGIAYKDLTPKQQKSLVKKNKAELEAATLKVKQEGDKRSNYDYIGKLVAEEKEVGASVVAKLSPKVQQSFKDVGISLGLSRKIGKYTMNDARYAEYQTIVAERLDKYLTKKVEMPSWDKLKPATQEKIINNYVRVAKNLARKKAAKITTAELTEE